MLSFAPEQFESHQDWLRWLHKTLPKPEDPSPNAPVVIDLFAGCGGMALGFEVAGFRTLGYEKKAAAVKTYNSNLTGRCEETFLTVGIPEGEADVIIGGPPCQPFSQIGYQRGNRDPRDGFPVFLDAVRRLKPKIAIIENVRGLLFRNKGYLHKAVEELARFGYAVQAKIIDAKDYGVPQNRERVVIVASTVGWEWPEPTAFSPVTAGMALGPLAEEVCQDSRFMTANMDKYVAVYEKKSSCVNPRDLYLDRPSRTVTCRNLGGATSDMLRIRLSDGRRRMLSIREGARLQSFPDWFEFSGELYEQMEQIGNAVAPLVAVALARQVRQLLEKPYALPQPLHIVDAHKMSDILDRDPKKEKVDQALNLAKAAGISVRDFTPRGATRMALALLAVARIKPTDEWADAQCHFDKTGKPLTTRQILKFWNANYGEKLADSSYDDIRNDLDPLADAGLVCKSAANPDADPNDGTRGYSIHEHAIPLLRSYGTERWESELIKFRDVVDYVSDRLSKAREFSRIPVLLPNGNELKLSPGPHNKIQKAIIDDFRPRFVPDAEVLYIGDALKKLLFVAEEERLSALGLPKPSRGTMLPDVLLYDAKRNWLIVIEAVHSSNPIGKARHNKLRELTKNCSAGPVYVSAFQDKRTFRRFADEISWQTDVWIADDPTHLIHFDGERFLGPYDWPTNPA